MAIPPRAIRLTNCPAARVIEAFGGDKNLAEAIGLHPTRIYRWTLPQENGGTGGLIPSKKQGLVLAEARKRGINLTPADLIEEPAQQEQPGEAA